MRRIQTVMAVALLLLALAGAAATKATAGIYEVHACRLPSGAPAPALGWTTTTAFGPGASSSINCPGGNMTAKPNAGAHSQESLVGFSFAAPTGTMIIGYQRHVEGNMNPVPGGPPPWEWGYGEFGTRPTDGAPVPIVLACGNCGGFVADWDQPLSQPLTRLVSAMACHSQNTAATCEENASHFLVRQFAVRLEDLQAPEVLSARGSLLTSSAPQRGLKHISLNVRDVGGGLLKSRVEVDGETLTEAPVSDNRGTCKAPYVDPVPCKLSATIELPIDTTGIADGRHQVAVRVFDATDSNSTLYGPVGIEVDNVLGPGSSGLVCPTSTGSSFSRRVSGQATRFGARASVSGRITGPLARTKAKIALMNRAGMLVTSPRGQLDRNGRFRVKWRPKASGAVRPVLVAANGTAQLCGAPVHLRVRAGVRFSVSPRRLANGESIRMTGRLRGRPAPRTRKTIAIQARAMGQPTWTTVSVVRAGASGRFSFRYRFRRTFQRTTYEFRAVSPTQKGYPYIRGWSRVRRALVTP